MNLDGSYQLERHNTIFELLAWETLQNLMLAPHATAPALDERPTRVDGASLGPWPTWSRDGKSTAKRHARSDAMGRWQVAGLVKHNAKGLPSPISGQEQYKGVQEQRKEAYR